MPLPYNKQAILEEALRLHALGWWIVPQAGKVAVVLGWPEHRLGEDDLRHYLADGRLNIALVLSRSDLIDVETDSPEAEALVSRLINGGNMTPTWRSKRGLHRLYKRPDGLPDRAKVEVDGVEFRLGMRPCLSTLPPSIHPDGGAYAWLPDRSWHEVTVSPLPPKLAELLAKGLARQGKRKKDGEPPPGKIPNGRRNDELHRYACRLVRSGLSDQDVLNALVGSNEVQCEEPLPAAEVEGIARSAATNFRTVVDAKRLGPSACSSWRELRSAWQRALHWTEGLDAALSVMLAVALSTEQQGTNQLFLQLIGEAGSAKTRLCDGMLTSQNCFALEHLTGFHSGWKDSSGEDFSLLSRINRKTLITPEGDVLMSSPRFIEIMSQQRRIFDGTSGASYKNRKDDLRWEGLRTPWIMAGTPALLNTDQSRLGDRFLRLVIDPPGADERANILRQVGFTEFRTVLVRSNCTPDSIVEKHMREAYRLTGGYVDHLRGRAEELLAEVLKDTDQGMVVDHCAQLGEFTALFRSRPDFNFKRGETHDAKEMPTRLTGQFVRLAACLAGVLQREVVDDVVLSRVAKVALDTARGRTLDIARQLIEVGDGGAEHLALSGWIGESEERTLALLRFLKRAGAVEDFHPGEEGGLVLPLRWKLTQHTEELCRAVLT